MHPASALLLASLLSASPLCAQPRAEADPRADIGRVQTHVEQVYYDIEGTTFAALADDLERRGPEASGKQFFGLTEWEVNAEYLWMKRPTGCAIEDLTVRVTVRTHLPRWEPPRGTSTVLSGAWSRFANALGQHEDGHRDLAEEAADAIRWYLVSIREPTCDRIEAAARQGVAQVLNKYEQRNRSYDAHTRHGLTQGAVWPPQRFASTSNGNR